MPNTQSLFYGQYMYHVTDIRCTNLRIELRESPRDYTLLTTATSDAAGGFKLYVNRL